MGTSHINALARKISLVRPLGLMGDRRGKTSAFQIFRGTNLTVTKTRMVESVTLT